MYLAMGDTTEEESVEEEVGQESVEEQGTWADTPWEECIDDSGNVYYYNRETGDSSWDLPQEFRSVLKDTEVTVLRRDSKLLAKVPKEETASLNAEVEKLSKENGELLLQVALLKDKLVAKEASTPFVDESKYAAEISAINRELEQSLENSMGIEVARVLDNVVSATEIGSERLARETVEAQAESAASQIKELEKEYERLEEELEEARDERSNSEQWLDKLRMELFEYEEALNMEREKRSEVEEQLKKVELEKAERLAEETTAEENRKIEQGSLAEQVKNKDLEIKELKHANSQLEGRANGLAEQLAETQKAVEARGVDISKLQSLLEQGKQQEKKQEIKLKEQADEHHEMLTEREELLQKLKTLEEGVVTLKEKVNEKEEEKRNAEADLNNSRLTSEELAVKAKQSEELRNELSKAIEKVASLEASGKAKEDKLKDLEEMTDQSLKQAEQEADALKLNLKEANGVIEAKQASIIKLQQEKHVLSEEFRKHQIESEKQILYVVENFNELREEYSVNSASDELLREAFVSSIIELSEEKYEVVLSASRALKHQLEQKELSVSLLQKHEEASRDAQKQQLQEQLSKAIEKMEKQKLAENLLREENARLSKNLNDTSSVVESLQRQYQEARQRNQLAETELANAANVARELDEEVKYLTEQKKKLSHAVISTKAEVREDSTIETLWLT